MSAIGQRAGGAFEQRVEPAVGQHGPKRRQHPDPRPDEVAGTGLVGGQRMRDDLGDLARGHRLAGSLGRPGTRRLDRAP